MLHVASVGTPCCLLLCVVGSCCTKFETDQTFSYVQTDATTSNNVGSCCVRFHVLLKVPTIDTSKDTKKVIKAQKKKNFHTLTTVRRKARRKALRRKLRASKYRVLRVGLQPSNKITNNSDKDANLTNLLSACKCSAAA